MIYATCINENASIYTEDDYLRNLITESVVTNVDFCLSELCMIDEVHIDDKYKRSKTKFEMVKEFVSRLWNSFRDWCKLQRQKLKELIDKVKNALRIKTRSKSSNDKKKSSSSNNKDTTNKQQSTGDTVSVLVLNSKFDKIDESKLIHTDILDLTAKLQNYDKDLYENYDNAAYTKSIVEDITGGEFSAIEDIKGKALVETQELSRDEASNISELDKLNNKYNKMVSDVDAYFNKLQTSIKRAEETFKNQMLPTSYSDDNISASSSNPLETRRLQFIINTTVKMIGAQSGVVRNVVYAKVAAITEVLSSRAI